VFCGICQDLLKKVENFEATVKSVTSSESADLEELETLLDEGVMLDIDLPDLTLLKQVFDFICFDLFLFHKLLDVFCWLTSMFAIYWLTFFVTDVLTE